MYIIGKKIVAVDDSAVVLKMLQKVLDKMYDLHLFTSGQEALQYLSDKKRKPDLIILDIEMPKMDGYEVLSMIRQLDHLADVPVIFLTSNSDKYHVVRAVADGAQDYVVKPVDQEVLLKKISAVLGN